VANDGAGAAPGAAGEPAGDSRSITGRLGGLWAITSHWSMRGNAGRYFRIPSLLELYGNEGTLVGNPSLRPEEGINADLGVAFSARSLGALRGVSFELSTFRTDTTDLIQLVTLTTRQVKAFNIGEARVTGVEASAAFRVFGRLGLSGNLTLQRPTDLGDSFNRGNDLPGTPRRQASTSESLDLSRVTIFHRLDYVGENDIGRLGKAASNLPAGRQSRTVLPARYLHDAGLRVRLGPRTTATLEVLNIFDRHVVDVARYPLPGRTIFFKLSGSL
ncbi:MAG TPA: TonB-dependent receptor, partial [Candidatus Saccharimonadales bacterium]|nr:TonB-dependent receptor [Candidatus Saccharimonadales bacterium]